MTRGLLSLTLAAAVLGALGCDQSPAVGGDDDVTDGRAPDGSSPDAGPPADAVVPSVAPDVDGRLTINEFMTSNALTIEDAGAASDWIEIYNPSAQAISLHGYGMTDDLTMPLKFTLPPGLTVPAGGFLVLWADALPARGPTHLGFKLGNASGALGLARPDGSWIDRLGYGAQEVDFSAARTPDGSDRWTIEWHPSPGTANAAGAGQPMGLDVASTPPEAVPAAGDLSERILGYNVLLQLALEVSPEAAASLEAQPLVYVPGHLVFDGRRYGPVGVRLKGANSFLPWARKPSLRINVDEYAVDAKFFGLKDLTLNNMSNDLSMMHERLAYLVARSAGVPASRANHALLTVNGQFYGVYTNVETVKKSMVRRWFPQAAGSLFEATDVDFVAADVPRYELEFGADDRSLLTGLAAALTDPSADAAIAAAGNYLDMTAFLRYWAMCSVVAQFDAFPYSIPGDDYFVYADAVSGRLAFVPWGMDETFYSGQLDVTAVTSLLARKCKESPACFQAYANQTWSILALTETMDLAGERTRVMSQIEPYLELDTRKPYTTDQVRASQADMYWFFADRRANFAAMIPPPR